MKRKYIKPTTEVFACIEEPIMDISGGVNNSGQSDDGGVGARGTDFDFMEDESEDNAMGCRYNLWEE
ncbi:MAG: hypothetical protein IKQ12_07240 [Prevotella sp.]|nr:hypothetical protein [Prevotella sp.]